MGALAVTSWQNFAYNDGRMGAVPSGRAAIALCVLVAAIFIVSVLRLRTRWLRLVLPGAAVLAAVTIVLGVAAYWPCDSNVPVIGQLGWTLQLFVGAVEEYAPGAKCANSDLPGFQAARTLGLLATFVGAMGAGLIAARGPFDRLRAGLSGDVDVVVGLDLSALELVRVLLAENHERPRREPWIMARPTLFGAWLSTTARSARLPLPGEVDVRWGDGSDAGELLVSGLTTQRASAWLREGLTGGRPFDRPGWMIRRPRVIVLVSKPGGGMVEIARDLGAIVLVGDPSSPELLRSLLTSRIWWRPWRRRVALRRMLVVADAAQLNLRVAKHARQTILPGYSPHRNGVVPRILVAFEDAWQGWAFRNSELTKHRWVLDAAAQTDEAYLPVPSAPASQPIVDGITSLDLVCQQLVERMISPADSGTGQPGERGWRFGKVVLVGTSASWFTLVNEIQWQVWTRYEVAVEARKHRGPGDAELGVSRAAHGPRVVLHGVRAESRAREWRAMQSPWQLAVGPGAASPRVSVGDSSQDLHELMKGGDVAVVFLDGGAEQRELAGHLARTHPADLVALFDPEAVGLSEPATVGAPYSFGPSWTRSMPGCTRQWTVGDSMTRIAEQQHLAYSGRWLVSGGDPWSTGRLDEDGSGRLTTKPWSRLPEFYREDNVRQIWHVLQWFVLNSYEWRTVGQDLVPAAPNDKQVLESLARSEYSRWLEMRRRNGWRAPRRGEGRDDFRRIHPKMAGLDDLSFDVQLVSQIVNRFWSLGLAPERLSEVHRTGPVEARQVTTRTTWIAHGSGLTHVAEPGDWRIQARDGSELRYLTHEIVGQLYRPVSEDQARSLWTLSREGALGCTPRARKAESREVVESPEGLVVAEPGDWIITQRLTRDDVEGFDRWPLADGQFTQGYTEEVRESPTDGAGTSFEAPQ
ncbi:MAG: hypothetical protein WCF36_19525 [Candidatus Nanopelagicales bacterium]